MTIPYLMNCSHQSEGWCLSCVRKLQEDRDNLLRQVEELDAKAMAEEMLKNGNYRLYEREKIRAETAEARVKMLEDALTQINALSWSGSFPEVIQDLAKTALKQKSA